jgi:TetR/AcrR family transcriptional regulator, cholesterol catabolism regulator
MKETSRKVTQVKAQAAARTPRRPKREEPPESGIGQRRSLAMVKGSESYQERRREIARVAAEVFNKQGFRGTSLGAVADALKTNRASLYYYIANKRELYDEVVREVSEANVATAQAVHASKATAPDKLRTLIVSLMESYATHYPLLYVYIRENLSHVESDRTDWSRYMRSLNRQYEEVFIAIVQEGLDDGSLRSLTTARVTAYGIIGMIGWSNRWFVPQKSDVSGRDVGLAFADMVLGGLVSRAVVSPKPVRRLKT